VHLLDVMFEASQSMNNAYAAFLAGIVVLSKDIMTISEEEIPTAYVVYTILGRTVVYSRPMTVN